MNETKCVAKRKCRGPIKAKPISLILFLLSLLLLGTFLTITNLSKKVNKYVTHKYVNKTIMSHKRYM